jgi:hypothetical protein
MLLTLDRPESLAFRRSLSQMAGLEWLPFAAAMADCLEPREDGWRASLETVCPFALVRSDDGDLPGTNASHEPNFARITSAKRQRTAVLTPGTAHFELRQFGHMAANGSILETDTPRQAIGCRFYINHSEVKPAFNTKISILGLLHDRVRLDKSFPVGPCSTSGDENSLTYDLGSHHCGCHVSTQ